MLEFVNAHIEVAYSDEYKSEIPINNNNNQHCKVLRSTGEKIISNLGGLDIKSVFINEDDRRADILYSLKVHDNSHLLKIQDDLRNKFDTCVKSVESFVEV